MKLSPRKRAFLKALRDGHYNFECYTTKDCGIRLKSAEANVEYVGKKVVAECLSAGLIGRLGLAGRLYGITDAGKAALGSSIDNKVLKEGEDGN